MTHKTQNCILIATDALSYGINLQHFQTVINFDQPYNPARLWQRIGRIYRISQNEDKEKYVYNTFTSLEQRVIDILQKKFKLFNEVINSSENMLQKHHHKNF